MAETLTDIPQEVNSEGLQAAALIDEATRLIEEGLKGMVTRELVSTDEVSDLLLDVRLLLTSIPTQLT